MKKFENRLTFGEVMGKSLVSCFFDSRCSVRCGGIFNIHLTASWESYSGKFFNRLRFDRIMVTSLSVPAFSAHLVCLCPCSRSKCIQRNAL